MQNKIIANTFNLLGKIMELHNENPFKIRSYSNAYQNIKQLSVQLLDMDPADIRKIKGIGNAITEKIQELLSTGNLQILEEYKKITPPGLVDLLGQKAISPKKLALVWKELDVESAGELLFACYENKLVDLKGFGAKSQDEIQNQLEYIIAYKDHFLFAHVKPIAEEFMRILHDNFSDTRFYLTGQYRRKLPNLDRIEVLTNASFSLESSILSLNLNDMDMKGGILSFHGVPIHFIMATDEEWGYMQFKSSSSDEFFEAISNRDLIHEAESEVAFFEQNSINYIPPELREHPAIINKNVDWTRMLIREEDIKGVIHSHSHYSDGLNSIEEMAFKSKELGYKYLVMSDHSKSAFYANGLDEQRVKKQWSEIDTLNLKIDGFKVFKGIESDILNNGDLDYEQDLLEGFDLVIASIHSNLRMDETKATRRLIKAVENPYTKILGHPTGRLLLIRTGYPVDHRKVIDACAANRVVIELNANPLRLDMDWKWIDYALSRSVMIAINPDAHHLNGLLDIQYGVHVARKGGLSSEMCLNSMSLEAFESWLSQ